MKRFDDANRKMFIRTGTVRDILGKDSASEAGKRRAQRDFLDAITYTAGLVEGLVETSAKKVRNKKSKPKKKPFVSPLETKRRPIDLSDE